MVKRYCDRCGAVIDNKSHYDQRLNSHTYQLSEVFDFGGSIKVDLCDICQKNLDQQIVAWLNGLECM